MTLDIGNMETVHKFLLFYLFFLMNATPIIPASISLTCAMSSRQLKMYFLASLDLIFVSPSCSSGVCKKIVNFDVQIYSTLTNLVCFIFLKKYIVMTITVSKYSFFNYWKHLIFFLWWLS